MRPSQAHLGQVALNHFPALQAMTLVLALCPLPGVVSNSIYHNSKSPSGLFIKRFHGDRVKFIQFRSLQLQTTLHSLTFLVFAEQQQVSCRHLKLGKNDQLL